MSALKSAGRIVIKAHFAFITILKRLEGLGAGVWMENHL